MRREILRMDHIVCRENDTLALNYFTMQVFEGEIYGILSLEQNGISTMIDLICYNREIEYGQVFFKEKLINRAGKSDGAKNKAEVIGTQPHLIEDMSLADNLFVIRSGFHPQILSRKKMIDQTQGLLDSLQLSLQPLQKIEEMSTLERFIAGILQAVVQGNRLIVLNDISDLLSSEELPCFHKFIRKLSNRGHSFIYIYQHHEVLRQICDRMGIFRNGSIQKVYWNLQNIGEEVKIFAEPLYTNVSELYAKKDKEKKDEMPVLEWKNMKGDYIANLDLILHPKETVLLLDRSNTALQEIMEKLKTYDGCRIGIIDKNPVDTMLFPELSYMDNLCFMLGEKVSFFWQKKRLRKNVRQRFQGELGDALEQPQLYNVDIKDLYTLVYYKYLLVKPDVLVCLQPLSGLDLYLRTHVLNIFAKFSERGTAILILATELYDTIYISDRLIQMEHGRVVGDMLRGEFENIKDEKAEIFPD